MKNSILLIFALLVSMVSFAGNPFGSDTTYQWLVGSRPVPVVKSSKAYGSLSELRGETRLFTFYSVDDAFYRNQPIVDTRNEFFDGVRLKAEGEICARFIERANEEVPRGFYLTGNPARMSRYVLKLHVVSVDPDGETTLCAMVFDTTNKQLVYQKFYNGNGGSIGSLVNLMGDAAERIGKKIGKDIDRVF